MLSSYGCNRGSTMRLTASGARRSSTPTRPLRLAPSSLTTSVSRAGQGHVAGPDGNAPLELWAAGCGWRSDPGSDIPRLPPQGVRLGWITDEGVFLDRDV